MLGIDPGPLEEQPVLSLSHLSSPLVCFRVKSSLPNHPLTGNSHTYRSVPVIPLTIQDETPLIIPVSALRFSPPMPSLFSPLRLYLCVSSFSFLLRSQLGKGPKSLKVQKGSHGKR